MKIGVVFPQIEIGADRGAVRGYAEAVSDLGYHHILAYDHVLGADARVHRGWNGPYDLHSTFHEPFVLFGYLAAIAPLELVTGIVVLPQRQTALVAKQAAEVDLLSGGCFRLGVGIGWNAVEYEALDKEFPDRGQRITEQVELMRLLWTEESVTFEGKFETVTGAGLAPLPIQRPIPVWFGATSAPALRTASASSQTVGSRCSPPGHGSTRPLPSLKRRHSRLGGSPQQLGWRVSSTSGRTVSEISSCRSPAGGVFVRPTCLSTR